MNKNKKEEVIKLPEVMQKYDAVFSLTIKEGWANVVFEKDYKDNIIQIRWPE